jgi:O-succinylbenzoic acid--CoA ligase
MNKIQLEGTFFDAEDFISNQMPLFFTKNSIHKKLYLFLKDWFSPEETISLYTSGSTGKPKEIVVRKSHMLQSAAMTCRFFNLSRNDKALLCLSTDYIAGKMMVVRAIYSGMNLYPVEVSGHPLLSFNSTAISYDSEEISFDFAAMIPLQVYNSLSTTIERSRLSKIKNIIIGGGSIDLDLEEALKDLPNSIYSTYGMTETLSHIGLRKVNGDDASLYYTPLEGIDLKLSDNQTLVIHAPHISDDILTTNDIAEIKSDGSFKILGRIDNIINTGGIKVQIEEVEQQLLPYLRSNFAVTSIPHPKLGEAIVLLVEPFSQQNNIDEIIKEAFNTIPLYHQPKCFFTVSEIPMTDSGKKDRKAIKELALRSYYEYKPEF